MKWSNGKLVAPEPTTTPKKKSAFMSEAEKKEEMILKQKAELTNRLMTLDSVAEQRIATKGEDLIQ